MKRDFVLFSLDKQLFAVPLDNVLWVVPAVAITPLPKAPDIILGIIDIGGQIIPAVDVRKRLSLPPREISIYDHFLIADTFKRIVVLVVDKVDNTISYWQEDIATAKQIASSQYIEGAVKCQDKIVFLYNLESFLSLDEESTLNKALKGVGDV